ncbi:hypothetical protein K7I13_13480 [Brucepastera parasyntrophica]|uniref:tetratricopeptide repeat protein n=1 Tax=Brucepastera parasyntrophica TaxID=2880008 RepID=UPI002108F643|nr:hypothetical protein [Brucepastera parasyntrophica]ULQ59469.1 hypothetical protein K7I13_13480 [Brucepastera parasyntrophica]
MRYKKICIAFICIIVSALPVFSQTRRDALVLYREGKYTEAIEVCLSEISENDRNVESYVVLCWSLVRADRYEEADAWSERGRNISRYDPRLIEIQAEAKYFLGYNDQSLRLFQDYISYAPNGSRIAQAYYFMGEIYLRQAKYRHADMSFSAALQLESLNAAWWVRLAYSREMAKEYRYALEAYNRALALNSNLQDAIRGRDRVTGLLR